MAVTNLRTNEDYFNFVAVLSALAITDTSAHLSSVADVRGFHAKSVVVSNGLNQTASVQVQVSHDGTTFANIGSAQSVTAGSTVAVDDSVIAQLVKPYAFVRLSVSCSVAPASGTISATVGGSVN